MKFKTYVFIASLVLLEIAAGTKEGNLVEGINPGDLAPELTVINNKSNNNIKFTNSEGRFTFINFWAAYDAESRVNNIYFYKEAKELGKNKLSMYSISLDKSKSVFDATVEADKLDKTQQLWNKSVMLADKLKEFTATKRIKNLLIDDKGVVVKQNLTPTELASYLSNTKHS